jgi:hypothetical protein
MKLKNKVLSGVLTKPTTNLKGYLGLKNQKEKTYIYNLTHDL